VKEVLIRHKATGQFESFDFAEEQELMEPNDEGTLVPVVKSRKEVFEALDPASYDVVDPDELTKQEQLEALDSSIAHLQEQRSKLAGKGAKKR
jgi:hypothetical protein